MRVRDVDRTKPILRELNKLMGSAIEVGIFGESGSEILLRATVNEFGAPSVNIPERSFIRAGYDRYKSTFRQEMISIIPAVVQGRISAERVLDILGESFVTKIRQYLIELDTPPNAESTIRKKGSSNPLIDTGQMRDSITYRVVDAIV